MTHSFDSEIAEKYGILEAILLNNIYYWIEKNRANELNFFDGTYWTYNSAKAFSQLFSYASERQINYALKHLREEEILLVGNYNEKTYDRTLWYSISECGLAIIEKREIKNTEMSNGDSKNVESILQNCQMEITNLSDGFDTNVEPIPDIKPDNKPNIKPNDNTVSNDTVRSTDVQRVIDAWNSLPGLSRITKIVSGTQRYDWLKVRIRDYGIEEVLRAIENVRSSPFLLGRSKSGWTIDFDWFVRPNNFPKVLDGNYLDDKSASQEPNNPESHNDGGETWQ
ncbi:hypothetical protein [Lacrimispora celerecrescens]|uniref:Uncharacterized protein n=1 Tax=[Clostridium] celerecrescens 18A TaxID=1286362 RepID=A0A2M8Z2T5_9FIRM|nr:hypothetical protein [Lacrimispora celerecrescens]PJJ27765.1 hypothetical protein H171_1241 [[Clostridium] celerecrescens 18A]